MWGVKPAIYSSASVQKYVDARPEGKARAQETERSWELAREFVHEHPQVRFEALAALREKAAPAVIGWDAAAFVVAIGALAVAALGTGNALLVGITLVVFAVLAALIIGSMSFARGSRQWLEGLESALEDAERNPRAWRIPS
jgi:Flp pilus assembly protein TadB